MKIMYALTISVTGGIKKSGKKWRHFYSLSSIVHQAMVNWCADIHGTHHPTFPIIEVVNNDAYKFCVQGSVWKIDILFMCKFCETVIQNWSASHFVLTGIK